MLLQLIHVHYFNHVSFMYVKKVRLKLKRCFKLNSIILSSTRDLVSTEVLQTAK